MAPVQFSIIITTKDRCGQLAYTLLQIKKLLERDDVECLVFDDGSTDGTAELIRKHYPRIRLFRNEKSNGQNFCRSMLFREVSAPYVISLDDDLHFLTENPLEIIKSHFEENPGCGLIAYRIFWGLQPPESTQTNEQVVRVKSYGAGANAWRLSAWQQIPDYPDWFVFHGEEDFAAYHLYKKGIEIHYVPEILTHHRVDLKVRKKQRDYGYRLRRSLASSWYLFFLFYPLRYIPKIMVYSVYKQLSLKVFKGDFAAFKALVGSFFDLIVNIPNIIKNRSRFSAKEFREFRKIEDARLYWRPGK